MCRKELPQVSKASRRIIPRPIILLAVPDIKRVVGILRFIGADFPLILSTAWEVG
jgi:hypothetical protein